MTKTCKRCSTEKALSEFPESHPGHARNVCSPCYNADRRAAHAKNPEQVRGHIRRWQRANPEKLRACAKAFHAKNPDYNRNWLNAHSVVRYFQRLEREFGLTELAYNQMHARQDYCCALCADDQDDLVVDHDHATNRVRGLICDRCNKGLGFLKDNPDVLMRAAQYVVA
jgi:hypothetical protein